ncbi:fumarylacetoacetate hydrolase family protein [Streptomyces sp. NPDC058171]
MAPILTVTVHDHRQRRPTLPMLPGDLIFTGTPSGFGVVRKPPVFLRHGDILETWVEDIRARSPPPAAPEPRTRTVTDRCKGPARRTCRNAVGKQPRRHHCAVWPSSLRGNSRTWVSGPLARFHRNL